MLRARGTVGLTRSTGADSLALAFDADSLGGLRRYLARAQNPDIKSLASDSLAGKLSFRGVARGWLDSLDVMGSLSARDVYVRGDRARSVGGTLALRTVRGHVTGTLAMHADTVSAGGIRVGQADLEATIIDAGRARFAASARAESGAQLRAAGAWSGTKDTTTLHVDTLDLAVGASRWTLRRPSVFTRSSAGVMLDTLLFDNGAGGRLAGFIQAPVAAPVHIRLRADSVPLIDVGTLAQLPTALSGRLSADLLVAGTREQPTMTFTSAARGLEYSGLSTELVAIEGGYANERATLQANVLRGGRSMLDATVSYPLALTLFSARATGDSIRGRVHADSVDLALVEALSPRIRNSSGRLALDLALSGQPEHPHVAGRASVRNGAIEMPDVGLRFASLNGDVTVDPARDSLTITAMRWVSPASGGSGALQGSIVFRDIAKPRLDLRLDAQGLRTVDKRGLARLDVSTGATGLTLSGTPEAATLSGAVTVDRGTIYIPELVRKQLVDITPEDFALLFDTTDVKNRSIMPQPPAVLVEHLRLDGVSVRIGDEVWLRSREANIKLGGTLNVTRARDDRETTRSTLARDPRADSARYKLALSGTLSADRGTYTLDLTAVQREFQVQTGRITFFGTPDFNPEIDVTALYQVKQSNRSDIGVRARIHGNFYPQPALELSSTDAYLSPSDLVSYLVTGHPSSEISDQLASQRAFEFVLPTAGAYVSRVLRDQLGGIVDQVQIQSGAVDGQLDPGASGASNQFRSFLYSTRLGGEKQISDKLFLSFSAGLCQLSGDVRGDQSQQGLNGFVNAIEGKLEYRFPVSAPERLSLRAGREPAASALRCNAGSVRGFVATPQQWGLSLFRSWSF